jgi:hypothetical protein
MTNTIQRHDSVRSRLEQALLNSIGLNFEVQRFLFDSISQMSVEMCAKEQSTSGLATIETSCSGPFVIEQGIRWLQAQGVKVARAFAEEPSHNDIHFGLGRRCIFMVLYDNTNLDDIKFDTSNVEKLAS